MILTKERFSLGSTTYPAELVDQLNTRLVRASSHLGHVYASSDLFGACTILIRMSLAFLRDLADPLQLGSPILHQMGSLVKVI